MRDKNAVYESRFLDPWHTPQTPRLANLITTIIAAIEAHEAATRVTGQRARKSNLKPAFDARISAVVCDLVRYVLLDHEGGLAVSLAHHELKRYATPLTARTLSRELTMMALPELGWLTMTKGFKAYDFGPDRVSVIEPGKRLLEEVQARGITVADLGRRQCGETIILKAAKPEDNHRYEPPTIDYADTPETERMRAEMVRINAHIAEADIAAFDDAIDGSKRHLTRTFNNARFDHGGRLFGGFWQQMKKAERKDLIQIDGQPVVTLDYGQMQARMIYGLQGLDPGLGDLYAIPGYEADRSIIKKVVAAALFATKPLSRIPETIKRDFPHAGRVKAILAAISKHRPVLADAFSKGQGFNLMYRESEILVAVLLKLIDQGITALPIHDAVVVATSNKEETIAIMGEIFRDHIGIPAVLSDEDG